MGEWIRNYWTEAFTGDDAGSEFADMIDNAETIEQSPIVHAHWIKGAFADIACSNCDFALCVSDSTIPKFAYCPHCGAKMDGRAIYDCNHDCEAIYEAYQKGKEDALKKINEEALKKIKK